MKKLVLLILGFILGALAMYFYCCQQEEPETVMAPTAPKGLITPTEASTLDKAYDERYQLISDSIVTRKGGDNRSSWFSLEDINAFLDYAENQAGELDYTMNGIRIYAGADASDAEGPGYTTYFMIPTGYANKSEGNMFMFQKGGNGDIPGSNGLNHGTDGQPPGANYPQ